MGFRLSTTSPIYFLLQPPPPYQPTVVSQAHTHKLIPTVVPKTERLPTYFSVQSTHTQQALGRGLRVCVLGRTGSVQLLTGPAAETTQRHLYSISQYYKTSPSLRAAFRDFKYETGACLYITPLSPQAPCVLYPFIQEYPPYC